MQRTLHLLLLGGAVLCLSRVSSSQLHRDLWKLVPGLVECVIRPRPYKIADKNQCDKYYICDNGVAIPQLCPDGTVFHFPIQNCILINGADCGGRPLLQESIKKNQCLKKTGLFPHEDPRQCDKYYQCLDGRQTLITCPEMLLFDRSRGVCDYADLADTSSCVLEPSPVVCPSRDEEPFSSSLDITKRLLPHPSDCRRFFFCETAIPRPLICEEHLAFDLETLSCIDKSQVQRCSSTHH
ncbi:protein obstructor-E-like [Daphnia carinata]|uniref:protein obstructor-E-like n=1 Tax=Daphnia carinata TaxID=120202 RepID=UPI00257C9702|nr:protein obstructor-E-like [Daphnia carinata]